MDLQKLFADFPAQTLKINEPMRNHTSFKVGGSADLLISPQSKEQVRKAVEILRNDGIDYFVMGNGSNLLVKDAGYRGVIIKIGEALGEINIDGEKVTAEAGALLSRVAVAAMNEELTGLEFASGIPGSFGGAICMNAGAYDGEIKDALVSAEVIDTDGRIKVLTNSELEFSYRSSRVQHEKIIVLEGTFLLTRGDMQTIKAKTRELNNRRRDKQPLEFPSAGSAFKRPSGQFAGKLIMDAGLSGFAIGGAKVSEKHCGFIINTGGASANDILELMTHVIATVKEKFSVELEPEIRILG